MRAEEEGLSRDRVVVDPGIGFGKRGRGDLIILKEIRAIRCLGQPILIGCSRKRTIGDATGARDLIHGTVAASALKHSIELDFNHVSVAEVETLAAGNGTGRVQR